MLSIVSGIGLTLAARSGPALPEHVLYSEEDGH